jgi:hypothetical protein
MRMVRRLLSERVTTGEDLVALRVLAEFVEFFRGMQPTAPSECVADAARDLAAMEHAQGLLEEMLVAGLAPLEEGL